MFRSGNDDEPVSPAKPFREVAAGVPGQQVIVPTVELDDVLTRQGPREEIHPRCHFDRLQESGTRTDSTP
jgi:hypothetical protein